MFHATVSSHPCAAQETLAANAVETGELAAAAEGARGGIGEACWHWARVGRDALGLLGPLLRPAQGIAGLEVRDSSFEEWEAVQAQFETRVRDGGLRVL